ncbi:unnamed protein product [Chironomus riparius]|uniref:Phenoloxidase-activating factor 2 n=1 Tax=Chironomus riparius TaxID=315576 RepID=A0A9N9S3W6_9DIPT|nr:unnamed protein product [Chironomus riparius]
MKIIVLLFMLTLEAQCQESGNFWWKNKDLVNSASQSRSLKESSAKIRTLPPRYRHEKEEVTTKKAVSLYDRDSHENEDNHAEYKYDNEPDCVCVPKNLCNSNNTLITDGNGLIDERSFNLCGTGNICCRLQKSTSKPIPQKITTTTQRNFLNFNISNITNLISTILRPVESTDFKPTTVKPASNLQCISKKGKRLQERILIDDEAEEGDEHDQVGETTFAEYPWMIELLKINQKTRVFEYKCGAVLVNPTTALTANHCLKSKVPSNFQIKAGEWDRSSALEYLPHQDRSVSKIIAHPQYYAGGLYNDIAILKWNSPLKLELNVQPLCLPEENEIIPTGTRCIVTAWGKTAQNSPTTDRLKFVRVPIVDHSKCQKQFRDFRLGPRFRLHESFVCAGGEEGLDACNNDGGSPLVCKRPDSDSYILAGLVSWGLDCGLKDVPGAYTNIFNLLKWIKHNL